MAAPHCAVGFPRWLVPGGTGRLKVTDLVVGRSNGPHACASPPGRIGVDAEFQGRRRARSLCQSMCWAWSGHVALAGQVVVSRGNVVCRLGHAGFRVGQLTHTREARATGKVDPLPAAAEQCWNSLDLPHAFLSMPKTFNRHFKFSGHVALEVGLPLLHAERDSPGPARGCCR